MCCLEQNNSVSALNLFLLQRTWGVFPQQPQTFWATCRFRVLLAAPHQCDCLCWGTACTISLTCSVLVVGPTCVGAKFQAWIRLVVGTPRGPPLLAKGPPLPGEAPCRTGVSPGTMPLGTAIASSAGSPAWKKLRIYRVLPFCNCYYFSLEVMETYFSLTCNQIPSWEKAKKHVSSMYKTKKAFTLMLTWQKSDSWLQC